MNRAVIKTAVCMLALALGAPALAQEPARIVDIRVGRHADYDRLVLELERPVELRRLRAPTAGTLVLELEARPLLSYQSVHTPYRRMGTVVVKETAFGARIEVESSSQRVRVFRLSDPTRVVLDFGDPGAEPFPAPLGTEAVPAPAATPEPPEPEPAEPVEAEVLPPEEAESVEPEPAEPAEAELLRPEEAEPVEPQPVVTVPLPEEGIVAPAPDPDDPDPPEAPALAPIPVPEPAAAPETRGTVEAAPEPAPPRARFSLPAGALLVGVAVLAVGLALSALLWLRPRAGQRQRAGASAESAPADWPRAAETITLEEIAGASAQVDLLDRRIDQEVRARIHLEQRLGEMQEELKVMRDRLQRAKRRGD